MPSTRELRRKIGSVKSTQKITQAMNLVAASKLTRARNKLDASRPYSTVTKDTISDIISSTKGINHIYLEERHVNKTAIIVITSDRGLCGAYNSTICKEAQTLLNKKDDAVLILVGSKGNDYFAHRTKCKIIPFTGISEKPTHDDAAAIGDLVVDMYKKGEVDEVILMYTYFKSVLVHEPMTIRLLPLLRDNFHMTSEQKAARPLMEYEPSPEAVLEYVIPSFINSTILSALIESGTSEQGARMTAMDSATDNAEELVDKYTLQYNRARQGYITQEVTEIVSGANALE